MMDKVVAFIGGFALGGVSGALYATNLFDKTPADLKAAQLRKIEGFKIVVNEKLQFLICINILIQLFKGFLSRRIMYFSFYKINILLFFQL